MLTIILYLLVLATLHAKQEIQIENKEGWAKTLPCWRLNVFIIKWITGKELTGYHCYMLLLFALLFHSPLLFLPFTLKLECLIMGCFSIYWVIEDYLWFILNYKHYGFKSFKPGKIDWHRRWLFGLPISYWISIIIGSIFLFYGFR